MVWASDLKGNKPKNYETFLQMVAVALTLFAAGLLVVVCFLDAIDAEALTATKHPHHQAR